jgi:hypothetical protein
MQGAFGSGEPFTVGAEEELFQLPSGLREVLLAG